MPKNESKFDYWQMISRQHGIINEEEQLKLKNSLITVVGCGGIGGAAAEMLVRMGVTKIKVVDHDRFETSNLNRQIMSNNSKIGLLKSKVTGNALIEINPLLEIEVITEKLTQHNVHQILKKSDLVIDALDNLITRIIMSRKTIEMNIPFIHGAIHGTKGQITTFTNKTPTYEELFKLPSFRKELDSEILGKIQKLNQDIPPSISAVPNIVGCLQAFEALKLITFRGAPILAPEMLIFDLFKKSPFSLFEY
jgi:molybdopterin/thiamine biosynthesis adenylyltransferase